MVLASSQKRGLFYLFVTLAFFSIILISKYNALTFPYPWNDEARFFLPSWSFSIDGSLRPAIINAKQGIYWVPHAYYVLFGLLLGLLGRTIEIARTISQIFVATAVALAVVNGRRISGSYWIAICTAAVLVSPPVILSANEVRMEAVVVLLFSLSILFASIEQEIVTLSCLLLSVLFHPALSIALVFYSLCVAAKYISSAGASQPRQRSSTILTISKYGFLVIALVAVALEAGLVIRNYPLFRAHMTYQADRKLGRGLIQLLGRFQGIIVVIESLFVLFSLYLLKIGRLAKQSYFRDLLPAMSLAFGLSLYGALGAEFQYDVYCLSFAPATFVSVGYRIIQLVA
jgi:hypothetical protein